MLTIRAAVNNKALKIFICNFLFIISFPENIDYAPKAEAQHRASKINMILEISLYCDVFNLLEFQRSDMVLK